MIDDSLAFVLDGLTLKHLHNNYERFNEKLQSSGLCFKGNRTMHYVGSHFTKTGFEFTKVGFEFMKDHCTSS